MNSLKFFSLAIGIFVCANIANAQSVKPAFKKLWFASYETAKPGKVKAVAVKDLIEITETGAVHFRTVYYNGVADTTYQLAEDLIIKLNKIFNGDKKLESRMVANRLKPGEHYAGNLSLISYVDHKDKIDNFIYVEPFMNDQFNDLMQKLPILPSKVSYKGQIIEDKAIENQIIESNNVCTYLPDISLPPSIKQ